MSTWPSGLCLAGFVSRALSRGPFALLYRTKLAITASRRSCINFCSPFPKTTAQYTPSCTQAVVLRDFARQARYPQPSPAPPRQTRGAWKPASPIQTSTQSQPSQCLHALLPLTISSICVSFRGFHCLFRLESLSMPRCYASWSERLV